MVRSKVGDPTDETNGGVSGEKCGRDHQHSLSSSESCEWSSGHGAFGTRGQNVP